jgi:ferredoxin
VSEAERVGIVASHYRLRVNPIACDAFGYCAELVPEIITRDEWGYPILDEGAIPSHLFPWVERVVRECPRRALFIEKVVAPRP